MPDECHLFGCVVAVVVVTVKYARSLYLAPLNQLRFEACTQPKSDSLLTGKGRQLVMQEEANMHDRLVFKWGR